MTQPILPSLLALSVVLVPLAEAQQRNRNQANPQDSPLVANAEADSLAIAEQLYSQAQATVEPDARRALMARSAELFGAFVKRYTKSEHRARAQYLQAVCQEEAGDRAASNKTLALIANKQRGEFAASAAYRLGTQAATRSQWEKALGYFAITVRETKRDELHHDAVYRSGRAQLELGRRADAEASFRQLQVLQNLQPTIRQAAVMALAQMKTEDGADAEAYAYYQLLLDLPGLEAGLRGTATLQAARLAARLGKAKESQQLYDKLSGMAGMEKYAGEAQMETIINLYRNKDYEGIVRQVGSSYASLGDPEKEARRALIIGQAYMELKRYDSAAQWLEVAERSLPRTAVAADAAYRRIVCAQQLRSTSFFGLAEKYLSTYAVPGAETAELPCNELVRLMYADRMLMVDAAAAARQFDALVINRLPEAVRPDALYKKAWSAAQGDTYDPVPTLNTFIETFKEDSRLPDALVLRGSCLAKQNKLAAALKDFDRVIAEFPRSEAAPISCQRAAQACAASSPDRMVGYYEKLIACTARVKPAAIAEAHYSIARALYEKDPARAIPHFEEARTINPEHYAALVDLSLVQCYYKLKDAEKLRESLVALEKANPASYRGLPPAILRWCGWMCAQGRKYLEANKYLTDALLREPEEKYTAADGTEKTRPKVEPLVWKTLAHARLELRQYERGLEAAEHYVSMETQAYRKADGMRDQAQLLIGLGRTADARKVCEEAISLGIDGPLKSAVFITLGDAFYAEKQFGEAAKYYGRTANVVNDTELKPQALYKIAAALKQVAKAGEAAQYEEILRSEFPEWSPSPNDALLIEGRPR